MRFEFDVINLDQIADSGQCFRWRKKGAGHYEIPCYGEVLEVYQTAEAVVEADCTQEAWENRWAHYFDVGCEDYRRALAGIPGDDAYLSAAARAGRGIRILHQPLWETMASFIISQNNNIPRIKKSLQALCDACGDPVGFPSPECVKSIPEETLRAIGLGYRAPYLIKAARQFEEDHAEKWLPSLGEAEAQTYLTSYLGIGTKVADCIRLFALGQRGTVPVDTWMRRILAEHYPNGLPDAYAPYAGIYQQYMFFYERQCSKA